MAALRPASQRRLGLLLAAVLALLAAAAASPASAAQSVETFDLPSAAGNIDLRQARLNRTDKLQATVMLPDGYDERPAADWPVLYLLHGVGDTTKTWVDKRFGDARVRAAGFPGIVVMPEGGRGYYTDAWMGGDRRGVNWERYELDEVVPAIESRYRIRPGRSNHAIAGLSMGGYGAVLLAAELPSYFGSAVTMSGLLNLERPESEFFVPFFSSFSYTRTWGRFGGPYVQAHNPGRIVDNLNATRLYVSSGDGVADPRLPFNPVERTLGGPTEFLARKDALGFAALARLHGNPSVTYSGHHGLHSWPYWRRELTRVMAWNPIGGSDATPSSWSYKSMAPHGNAWGVGFEFAAQPRALLTLTRSGQVLTAGGQGTLTVRPGAAPTDATGRSGNPACTFTAELPFTRTLPPGC